MLTADQKRQAFILATQSFADAAARWEADATRGLTDSQLAERLAYELGSYGGHARTGLDVEYTADGLRIWARTDGFVRRTTDAPIMQSAATIAFARVVYGIPDPDQSQLSFL